MEAKNKTLVAMSGGVDSSVAAAELLDQGHEVVGVTLKLWGGESDSGCCSVSDVEDARAVARNLGIEHHVFNFGDDFNELVVDHYIDQFSVGNIPNPCIECNRHIKFDKLLRWADTLGFGSVATGHHARISEDGDGARYVRRGQDRNKDQSYVLYMLDQRRLATVQFPIGHLTKTEVREKAEALDLGTANKPDSQNVCFINSAEGRRGFLAQRTELTPGQLIDDETNQTIGDIQAIELVSIGQRKGLNLGGKNSKRYVVSKNYREQQVRVGSRAKLLVGTQKIENFAWSNHAIAGQVSIQASAHGKVLQGEIADDGTSTYIKWPQPEMPIARGQAVVAYLEDRVVGGGTAS